MRGETATDRKDTDAGWSSAQRLADLLLQADGPNLEAALADTDQESIAAALGLSLTELTELVSPAIDLSAKLVRDERAQQMAQSPATSKSGRRRQSLPVRKSS
jgi:hypothetical protein